MILKYIYLVLYYTTYADLLVLNDFKGRFTVEFDGPGNWKR